MASSSPPQITRLLVAWRNGDETALSALMPFVYDELRRLAHRHMRKEREGHTLQTTALIHEAYMRLGDYREVNWQERAQFFAISAKLMRRILIESARARERVKRGGKARPISLDASSLSLTVPSESGEHPLDIIALDEAMTRFEALYPRKAKVVEMHFFACMKEAEIAAVLGVHLNTVSRDLVFAKAWLRRELSK
jgi:RNA polymerase sigma factor (TIGR02999 family)